MTISGRDSVTSKWSILGSKKWVVLVTFHTLPVGRSGPYFILLSSYIAEQKYKVWARSAHGKCVKSDQNHPFFGPNFWDCFFSDPGSSHESWNHLKFGGFDRSLTFFKWVWRKKFHVDFSSPMYGKQKWKKNPCRYQYIKRVRVHLKGGRNAFLRLVKNTQKTLKKKTNHIL